MPTQRPRRARVMRDGGRPAGGRAAVLDRSKNRASVAPVRAIRRFTVRPVLPDGARRAGRAGRQPALVLAPGDPGRLREVDPDAVGVHRPRPGPAARRRRPRPGSTSWPPTTASCARLGAARADLAALPHRRPLVPAPRPPTDAPRGDRLLLARSSASPPCCRSTPAASASSPATTSRPPATSACRSSASACSTGTATSSSRSPARAGSRRPTRSSTPTGCRSRCCARPTAPARRSRSTCPAGPTLVARIWVASVGRVPLLMLDTDVEGNPDHYVDVTDRLYGGNSEHRLRQELLLGVGGVRALRAYCRITGAPAPEVFHTNEGHAGFLGIERIRELTVAEGGPELDFDTALEVGRASHRLHHPHAGAGRHRPVPARPWSSSTSASAGADPGRPGRPDPRARRRGLRRRRRRRSSTWR